MTSRPSTRRWGIGMPGPLAAMDEKRRNQVIVAVLLVVAIAYPYFYKAIPPIIPRPDTNAMIVMMAYAVLALGLNIVVGFAGLLDLGYVAFFAIGAYTTGFLASPHFNIFLPWLIVVWVAAIVAAASGILLGAPTLRLRGDYLAIVTLGFGEIVPLVFRNLGNVTIQFGDTVLIGPNANITGGNLGINPISPLQLPIAGPWGQTLTFNNTNLTAAFYLILVILVVSFFFNIRLRDSRLGRAWMAIREDETAAAAMGINTVTTKLLAFALGASFSGFVGAFLGAYQTAIFPDSFKFSISITILVMVILGGMGSLRGAVVGAFAIMYVNLTGLQWLGQFINPPINSLGNALDVDILRNFVLHSYSFLIFGIILVVMMIVRPEGLLPTAARKAELHGEGISSDETMGTDAELARAESTDEAAIVESEVVGIDPDAPPAMEELPPDDPSSALRDDPSEGNR